VLETLAHQGLDLAALSDAQGEAIGERGATGTEEDRCRAALLLQRVDQFADALDQFREDRQLREVTRTALSCGTEKARSWRLDASICATISTAIFTAVFTAIFTCSHASPVARLCHQQECVASIDRRVQRMHQARDGAGRAVRAGQSRWERTNFVRRLIEMHRNTPVRRWSKPVHRWRLSASLALELRADKDRRAKRLTCMATEQRATAAESRGGCRRMPTTADDLCRADGTQVAESIAVRWPCAALTGQIR